jgi:lysophospholipase L1-like esterase
MRKILVVSMLLILVIFVAMSVTNVSAQGQIYMLGDSITALTDFNDYISIPVKNRGICGATSATVKAWLPHILGKDAGKVFVMIGINNLGNGASSDKVAKSIMKLLDAARLRVPAATLYLESVLPTRVGDAINAEIVSLNEQLKTMANEKGIEFIDVHDFFAESDGITAMKEYIRSVHLSDSGKQLWCSLLAPYMH